MGVRTQSAQIKGVLKDLCQDRRTTKTELMELDENLRLLRGRLGELKAILASGESRIRDYETKIAEIRTALLTAPEQIKNVEAKIAAVSKKRLFREHSATIHEFASLFKIVGVTKTTAVIKEA